MAVGHSKEEKFTRLRKKMVESQILTRNIRDERVIQEMLKVPRHTFVPPEFIALSYDDSALPISDNQTISQPYIVALMTELLEVEKQHHVLEVGTGSGYQAAILARLANTVCTIEIIPTLYQRAQKILKSLGYTNIFFRVGDGTLGWKEKAPFDRIIVTAAPGSIPHYLVEQLKCGGKLLLPLGVFHQRLVLIEKDSEGKINTQNCARVRFVPMTGIAEQTN
jgi:protein-L-isoaspartate(D-aspartate) O-methyltransferase